MIQEIAKLTIDPSRSSDFERAVSGCAPLFRDARGCHAMSLERGIENPASYNLRVEWESVEDHMIHFRASEAFATWRAAVSSFFLESPIVEHVVVAATYF